jgi:hypothetical protein
LFENLLLPEEGRDKGVSQLPSFHGNHKNLRSTMKSISRGLITKRPSQGKSLARVYFSKQDKVGKESKKHFLLPHRKWE